MDIVKKLTFEDVFNNRGELDFIIVTPWITIDTSKVESMTHQKDPLYGDTIQFRIIDNIDDRVNHSVVINQNDCRYIQIKEIKGHLHTGRPLGGVAK